MILVSFFLEDNVLSEEIQKLYIFGYQITKFERSAFWGTPGIINNSRDELRRYWNVIN